MPVYFWLILPVVVVLGIGAIVLAQPRFLLSLADRVIPGVIYFAKTDRKLMALTIDDGPDLQTTPKILEILRRYNCHATFFLISDRVSSREDIVQKIVDAGHELGNHLTEDRPSIQLSPKQFETELLEAHDILSQFGQLRWLRPASGWYGASIIAIAHKHHYQVALGSIFPFDSHIASSGFSSAHILWKAAPGSIIVLHDNEARGERTAATLERILPNLLKRGYQLVTLSELFAA